MELEFRDGTRYVPEYLARMMSGIETHRYTYEQAVQLANNQALGDLVGRKQQAILDRHFKEWGS